MNRLNTIHGVSIQEQSLTKRPNINLSILAKDNNLDKFLAVFDWLIQEAQQK